MIDTGAFAPALPPSGHLAVGMKEPDCPVVQLLLCGYLAERPLRDLRCVAQTRHRHRCSHPVLAPTRPAGTWRLLPAQDPYGQLTLPVALMAVYDLGHLPHPEQLRWRAQRCPAHAGAPSEADLALAGWQPFDPLLHATHICTHPPARRDGRG
jgi:hypothetical protein